MTKPWWLLVLVAACGDGDPTSRPDAQDTFDGSPVPVTITVTVGSDAGVFAYQDGDQPFVLATPQGGVITFAVTSTRYALARQCSTRSTRIFYRAASETTLTFGSCQPAAPGTDKLAGSITTVEDAINSLAHGAASTILSDTAGETTFPYTLVTTGTADVVAARQLGFDAPDRLHVERDVTVSGTVTRDLTFADLATPASVTQPIPQDAGAVYTHVMTATSSVFVDDYEPPFTFVAFAPDARRASDRYSTSVRVDLSPTSSVTIDRVVDLPQPITSLPTANLLDAPSVTGNTATWNRIAGLDETLALVSSATGLGIASFSSAWSDAATEQRWQVPDLATLAGWPATGGFRGALEHFTLVAVVENKPYPELGYESNAYERAYDAPTRQANPRLERRAARDLVRTLRAERPQTR